MNIPRILIIAGSDCSGGAGIQADIKTVQAQGGYSATAITAITVQNTLGVHGVLPIPPEIISAQIAAVMNDIGADAIKIGMLGDAATTNAVAKTLREYPNIPIILDPVMKAKGGADLLVDDAIQALIYELIPLATLITPNIPEAEKLLGYAIKTPHEMELAAFELTKLSAHNFSVLLKGGHMVGDDLIDMLWHEGTLIQFTSNHIKTKHTHGTGCTMASAIATLVAQGVELPKATKIAQEYVHGAILNAPQFGGGCGPLWHGWKA